MEAYIRTLQIELLIHSDFNDQIEHNFRKKERKRIGVNRYIDIYIDRLYKVNHD